MRALALLVLSLSAAAQSADDDLLQFKGRLVADVIDEFREAGEPFAYSTNLVTEHLVVEEQPEPGEPVQIVEQILRPHGLTIRTEAGVYLVVRARPGSPEPGSMLLVVTSAVDNSPVNGALILVEPELPTPERHERSVFEFPDVGPGRYEFTVDAPGFETAHREVSVRPGEVSVVSVGMERARREIENIEVTASRYEILRDDAASKFVLDQRTIQNMPDLGEDPVRIVQRLPGAAASGASAKTHLRGGESNEIGILLNGQRLFDPFHVRDYQSIFSTVDSRAIEGVEVYTGGFPAQFGNRMSGIVLMESLDALQPRHTEIGLSVFNTSVLTAGKESGRSWLFSGRRGNLDLVLDPQYGSPSYFDIFAHYSWNLSPTATLSLNALYSDDEVEIILESDPEELERMVSDTSNAQLWARLDNRWSDELSSTTVISAVAFDNSRRGSLNDDEKIVAGVADLREISQFGFRQDFSYVPSDHHQVRWGLEVKHASAEFDYRNQVRYFGLPALDEDQTESSSRSLMASPSGATYALYFSDRWKLGKDSIIEWGLRFDDQTYTENSSDAQLSPRLSYLHTLGPATELRLAWGRYHQAQEINELQIEDGIDFFWPAQRADHYIAGIRHLFGGQFALRVEIFRKTIQDVQPRFENLFNPLALIPEVQPDRIRLDPSGGQSDGLEITIDSRNGPFNWWATYVLSRATDRIGNRDELRSWDQRHAFQGGLSWSSDSWDVSVAANVHTGWPLTELELVENGVDPDGEVDYTLVPGPRNSGRYSTFASIDFRVSRTWKLNRGSFMAFLEVTNLTNRSNQCCQDYDLEFDDDTGGVALERSLDYWMPLLPAVGILWQF